MLIKKEKKIKTTSKHFKKNQKKLLDGIAISWFVIYNIIFLYSLFTENENSITPTIIMLNIFIGFGIPILVYITSIILSKKKSKKIDQR